MPVHAWTRLWVWVGLGAYIHDVQRNAIQAREDRRRRAAGRQVDHHHGRDLARVRAHAQPRNRVVRGEDHGCCRTGDGRL